MTSDFAFEAMHGDGVHVITLHGDLDMANAARVRDLLVGVAGSTVVVDLANLEFLDSSGIAALLGARTRILASGNEFQLRGARGIVRRVLEMTGLAHLLVE